MHSTRSKRSQQFAVDDNTRHLSRFEYVFHCLNAAEFPTQSWKLIHLTLNTYAPYLVSVWECVALKRLASGVSLDGVYWCSRQLLQTWLSKKLLFVQLLYWSGCHWLLLVFNKYYNVNIANLPRLCFVVAFLSVEKCSCLQYVSLWLCSVQMRKLISSIVFVRKMSGDDNCMHVFVSTLQCWQLTIVGHHIL